MAAVYRTGKKDHLFLQAGLKGWNEGGFVFGMGVDLRSGRSLSAGRAVSLLGASACGVSPVPLFPQESRALHSNQRLELSVWRTIVKEEES